MKKQVIAAALSAVMVIGMVGCGSSASSNSAASTASTAASEAATTAATEAAAASTEAADATSAAPAADASDFSVGLVADVGGVNDGSFNQSAWAGLQKASQDLGIKANYLESSGDADYKPNIEAFMDEDTDLIICVGYMLADALREEATANPDQKFAIIDDASCADLPNVTCLMFKQEQASYLVGVVAGMMTKTNNVGFILGMASDTMHLFGYGYVAGVLDTNPDCKIQQMNANSFADPATGKSDANSMITNGADIIFHAAGGTGNGVIEGCQEGGIYAIGVDSDQSSIAPKTVITSAMKRVDNAVYDASKNAMDGSLQAGIVTYDITNGGVDIAPTTDLLTDDVITKVNQVKQDMIDGKITVPSSKDEFGAKYGDDAYQLDN